MGCLAELIATTETGEIPVKHPLENRTYGIDFTDDLETGETVDDVTDIDISSMPEDLTFSNLILVNDGTQLNVKIAGGSHPVGSSRKYSITVVYDTNLTERKVSICELIIGTP